MTLEVNFDGLIGPGHNYAGLSPGNLASASHAGQIAYPRAAALQGLAKMRTLYQLGYKQGFFPPQLRPNMAVLRQLGFSGSHEEVLKAVAQQAPELLAMVYSASSMWAANAATVTPSLDAPDGRVHFTVANLVTTPHRAIESPETTHCLNQVFADTDYFAVHPPLMVHAKFGDEGAANHNRICSDYGEQGVGLFVYGDGQAVKFPARQTYLASQAVARQHGVLDRSVFLKQSAAAIDAGAFHNDVVAVANGPVLFFHESAYEQKDFQVAAEQIRKYVPDFKPLCVPASKVSLEDAISSYLFNSQLVATPTGDVSDMTLIAPVECQQNPAVLDYLQQLSRDNSQPIRDVVFVDVRQSMSNGGGPACLRLRVQLSEEELAHVDQRFIVDTQVLEMLTQWVSDFYRDELAPADLLDPGFMDECFRALKALEVILDINGYYAF